MLNVKKRKLRCFLSALGDVCVWTEKEGQGPRLEQQSADDAAGEQLLRPLTNPWSGQSEADWRLKRRRLCRFFPSNAIFY
jgi:hypothetical protein